MNYSFIRCTIGGLSTYEAGPRRNSAHAVIFLAETAIVLTEKWEAMHGSERARWPLER
jgi:hypothetical protein